MYGADVKLRPLALDLGRHGASPAGAADARQVDLRAWRCGLGSLCGLLRAIALVSGAPAGHATPQGAEQCPELVRHRSGPQRSTDSQAVGPIPPEQLAPPFWRGFEQLRDGDYLAGYQGHLGRWLCALEGTQYFSSQQIHCAPCSMRVVNDRTYYSHTLVAPLLVAPGEHRVMAREPEFVRPQDGHAKQDCELRAAERWLQRNSSHFPAGSLTLLGDDLPKVPSAVRCVGARVAPALRVHLQTRLPPGVVSGN